MTAPDPNFVTHRAGTPMTVARLRADLATLPDDLTVVLARDGEGNGFGALTEVTMDHWRSGDGGWLDGGGEPCVVLWPEEAS